MNVVYSKLTWEGVARVVAERAEVGRVGVGGWAVGGKVEVDCETKTYTLQAIQAHRTGNKIRCLATV